MVTVENIKKTEPSRFINRAQLEEMEGRLIVVPPFPFYIGSSGSQIFVDIGKKSEIILSVHRLGCTEFYKHARDDIELLTKHVRSADEENDRLIDENKRLKDELQKIKNEKAIEEKKTIPDILADSILNIEDALWTLNEVDLIQLKPMEEDDLQTSKELLESGRNLILLVSKNMSKY